MARLESGKESSTCDFKTCRRSWPLNACMHKYAVFVIVTRIGHLEAIARSTLKKRGVHKDQRIWGSLASPSFCNFSGLSTCRVSALNLTIMRIWPDESNT